MDKQAVQEWVKTLRSGRFDQGHRALRPSDNQRCCLGVACDLFAPERWVFGGVLWESQDRYTHAGVAGVLPHDIASKLGISASGAFSIAGYMRGIPEKWAEIEPVLDRYPGAMKLFQRLGMYPGEVWVDTSLVRLNDDLRFNFEEIADVLEAAMELPEVFDFGTHRR